MRKNKFIKLIEHILVALPMLMILATTCYTIFNSNAKDSYSDSLQLKLVEDNNIDNFTEGSTYFLFTNGASLPVNASQTVLIKFDNWVSNMTFPNTATYFTLGYSRGHTTTYSVTFYDVNKSYISNREIATGTNYDNINETSFRYLGYDTLSGNANAMVISTLEVKQLVSYIGANTLDGAFEYSMGKFNELGFDKLNFTGFFEDIFFEGQPNVYLTFVNNYLNYMLFVECTFILPLVLYWFIHIGEHIVHKFEEGGFLK